MASNKHQTHTVCPLFTLNQCDDTKDCCVPHNVQLQIMLHAQSITLRLLWWCVDTSNTWSGVWI